MRTEQKKTIIQSRCCLQDLLFSSSRGCFSLFVGGKVNNSGDVCWITGSNNSSLGWPTSSPLAQTQTRLSVCSLLFCSRLHPCTLRTFQLLSVSWLKPSQEQSHTGSVCTNAPPRLRPAPYSRGHCWTEAVGEVSILSYSLAPFLSLSEKM